MPRPLSSTSLAALLLSALCLPLGARQEPAEDVAPPLTANEMSQRSERFLTEVSAYSPLPATSDALTGQRWPRSAAVKLLPPGNRDDRNADLTVRGSRNQPVEMSNYRWHVRYRDAAVEVAIDPTNGSVASFLDTGLRERLSHDSAPEPADCISQAVALSRTAHYLRAAGFDTAQLFVRQAEIWTMHYPADASARIWFLHLSRLWQGVPFADNQSATMMLDAGKGRLLMLNSNAPAPPPPTMRVEITPEQATNRAVALLKQHHYTPGTLVSVDLQCVLPNYDWANGGAPIALRSRLAWACFFEVYSDYNVPMKGPIWVDALTGEILGGGIVGEKGGGVKTAESPLRRTLRSATALCLKPLSSANKASAQTLTRQKDVLRFYGALSGWLAPSADKDKQAFVPTHQLEIIGAKGEKQTWGYDSHSGLIGSLHGTASERLTAGPGFRQWAGSRLTDLPMP